MASSAALAAVADASGGPAQAALSSLPGLQLLLRILPFRRHGSSSQQQQQLLAKLPRHQALEELHRHPLWRYGSTAAQWPEPRQGNNQPLAASEAESALLAYVRMAAEAEQHAGTQRPRRSRQQLSTADIAAELHALYTLAAIHVSQQQCPNPHLGSTGSAHSGQQALPDGDVMQLLKAYASLEDRSQHGSGHGGQGSQHGSHSWDNKTQAAAAAAMEAFWAFATLADAPQQEQTQQDAQQEVPHGTPQQAQPLQQSGQAPGQLQAGSGPCSSSPAHGHKQAPTGRIIQGSSSDDSNRSVNSAPGDLQVLLQLAQLSLQAAS